MTIEITSKPLCQLCKNWSILIRYQHQHSVDIVNQPFVNLNWARLSLLKLSRNALFCLYIYILKGIIQAHKTSLEVFCFFFN